MPDVVIENHILNSPFRGLARHWRFGDSGITNEVVAGRRLSSYLMPIPASKVRGKQLEFETQRTGSMFHPLPPSPTFYATWPALQAIEVIYDAIGKAMPESVPAWSGSCLRARLVGQARGNR